MGSDLCYGEVDSLEELLQLEEHHSQRGYHRHLVSDSSSDDGNYSVRGMDSPPMLDLAVLEDLECSLLLPPKYCIEDAESPNSAANLSGLAHSTTSTGSECPISPNSSFMNSPLNLGELGEYNLGERGCSEVKMGGVGQSGYYLSAASPSNSISGAKQQGVAEEFISPSNSSSTISSYPEHQGEEEVLVIEDGDEEQQHEKFYTDWTLPEGNCSREKTRSAANFEPIPTSNARASYAPQQPVDAMGAGMREGRSGCMGYGWGVGYGTGWGRQAGVPAWHQYPSSSASSSSSSSSTPSLAAAATEEYAAMPMPCGVMSGYGQVVYMLSDHRSASAQVTQAKGKVLAPSANASHVDEGRCPQQRGNELSATKELLYRAAALRPLADMGGEAAEGGRAKRRNVSISKDPQSVAARLRRERISEKIRTLQRLVPSGTKMDTASMLDEAVQYLKFLKAQVHAMSTSLRLQPPNPPTPYPFLQPSPPFLLPPSLHPQYFAAAAAAAGPSLQRSIAP